jgi:putative DNA primase/helicase
MPRSFSELAAVGLGEELIPVLPPNATLSPHSHVSPDDRGKVPGAYRGAKVWSGYSDWTNIEVTPAMVKKWDNWPTTNVGLRSSKFPGVDLDINDPALVAIFRDGALEHLGPAPIRGRANSPRVLLPYMRAANELRWGKLHLDFEIPGVEGKQLIDFLAHGQQYLIQGTHPSGNEYKWDVDLVDYLSVFAETLTAVTEEKWDLYIGWCMQEVQRLGGRVLPSTTQSKLGDDAKPIEDESFRSSSFEKLAAALAAIPNKELSYNDWVSMLRALKAACGGDEGFYADHVVKWSLQYPGNTAEETRHKWGSFNDSTIGAEYVYWKARENGWSEPQPDGFDFMGDAPDGAPQHTGSLPLPPQFTDIPMSERFVAEHADVLRYATDVGKWFVWDGKRWFAEHDTVMSDDPARQTPLIRTLLSKWLTKESGNASLAGLDIGEIKAITNSNKHDSVLKRAADVETVHCRMGSFDLHHWLLNTPAGIIDLEHGGVLLPHDSTLLIRRMTLVSAADTSDCPRFKKFMLENCSGDADLLHYLHKVLGMSLTGITREQFFWFINGPGGTGKGSMIRTLQCIMGLVEQGGFASVMDPNTLCAGRDDQHPTGLARLDGARLITASEPKKGRFWNDDVVNRLSGQDVVTARFMGQNFFMFKGVGKVIVEGNNRPHLNGCVSAFKRRLRMVPFRNKVKEREQVTGLEELLQAEAPEILRWLIEGCQLWLAEGLEPTPPIVIAETDGYLHDEDTIASFILERCEEGTEHEVSLQDLYTAFQQWSNAVGIGAKSKADFKNDLADSEAVYKVDGSMVRGVRLKVDEGII